MGGKEDETGRKPEQTGGRRQEQDEEEDREGEIRGSRSQGLKAGRGGGPGSAGSRAGRSERESRVRSPHSGSGRRECVRKVAIAGAPIAGVAAIAGAPAQRLEERAQRLHAPEQPVPEWQEGGRRHLARREQVTMDKVTRPQRAGQGGNCQVGRGAEAAPPTRAPGAGDLGEDGRRGGKGPLVDPENALGWWTRAVGGGRRGRRPGGDLWSTQRMLLGGRSRRRW